MVRVALILGALIVLLLAGALYLGLGDDRGTGVRDDRSEPALPRSDHASTRAGAEFDGDSEVTARTDASEPIEEARVEILCVGAELLPLSEARLWHARAAAPLASDGNGRWSFAASELPLGSHGLIVADGFLPARVLLRTGTQRIVLDPDPGLELNLVWRRDRQPVVGAEVVRRMPLEHDRPMLEVGLNQLQPASVRSDDQGRVLLFGLSVGRTEAWVEVRHAEALPLLVPIEDLEIDEDTGADRSTTVVLDRAARPLRLMFVFQDLQPVSERPVQCIVGGVPYETRTDEAGKASLPLTMREGSEDWLDRARMRLDLGDGRFWLTGKESKRINGERLYVAWHFPVQGHVRAPDPQRFEVATAVAWSQGATDAAYLAQPRPWQSLSWAPVSKEGLFRIDSGWQGQPTCVLLRLAKTHRIVAWALAPPKQEVVIEPPGLCRLRVEIASGRAQPGWMLELRPDDRAGEARAPSAEEPLRIALTELPLEVDLIHGAYEPRLITSHSVRSLARLDARTETARLRLELPQPHRLFGRVRGSYSGPARGARWIVLDATDQVVARGITQADGGFELEVIGAEPSRIQIWWPRDPAHPQLEGFRSFPIHSYDEALEFELPEGKWTLGARPDPANPAVASGLGELLLHMRTEPEGRPGPSVARISLEDGEQTFLLPAGDYWLRQRAYGPARFEQDFKVEAGRAGQLDPRWTQAAVAEFVIRGWPAAHGRLSLQVFDEREDLVYHEDDFRLISSVEPRRVPILLPAGDYRFALKGAVRSDTGRVERAQLDWRGRQSVEFGHAAKLEIELDPIRPRGD